MQHNGLRKGNFTVRGSIVKESKNPFQKAILLFFRVFRGICHHKPPWRHGHDDVYKYVMLVRSLLKKIMFGLTNTKCVQRQCHHQAQAITRYQFGQRDLLQTDEMNQLDKKKTKAFSLHNKPDPSILASTKYTVALQR